MSMFKAALLGLMIPVALTAPSLAQDADAPVGPEFLFSQLDLDGDGGITLEEIANAPEARFAALDTDGNGAVDRDELLAAAEARAAARVDRMLARADADGDGLLTQEELAEMRGGRGPTPERLFARVDADGDGIVTEAEFDAMAERMMGGEGRMRPGVERFFGHGHGPDRG